MFSGLTYGNSNANYSSKNLTNALKRVAAYHALLIPLRGPKMLWMGGELGYEVSINSTGERTASKPFRWQYLADPNRAATIDAIGRLGQLKQHVSFGSSNYVYDVSTPGKILKLTHDSMNSVILGNFDIVSLNLTPSFQHTGWWYNYMSGDSINITTLNQVIPLPAGDFIVYTDKNISPKKGGFNGLADEIANSALTIFPNPSKDCFYVNSNQMDLEEISVLDLNGRILSKVFPEKNSSQQKVITESLEKGVYLVEVKIKNSILTRKIVVE
jgi:hypothetical protein